MEKVNPVLLQIYRSLLENLAAEMGAVLKVTSFSANIKERLDFSCAIFNENGDMIIQAAHIPVHLGSMPLVIKEIMNSVNINENDIIIINDPYAGGTHLPDITLIKKIVIKGVTFYLANRAHHADVGGMSPGSMPLSRDIFQEGIIIPALKLIENGKRTGVFDFFLNNVRTPEEREGDLQAQINALNIGEKRLKEISSKHDINEIKFYCDQLILYSSYFTKKVIKSIPNGTYSAIDFMDDDGYGNTNIVIKVQLTIKDEEIIIDFTGTSKNVTGCINAPYPVTNSAVLYVLRSLIEGDVATNSGILLPCKIIAESGSLINPEFPHAVSGGNVETSQRIVDVLYRAFSQALPDKIPAASQGTMNNVTLGSSKHGFAYYETIPGGMGASKGFNGLDAIQTHMTNTLNTPIEAFESAYPMEIIEYKIREDSGGDGMFRGGNGIIKKIQALVETNCTVLSERRANAPYGLKGGKNGKRGRNYIERINGEIVELEAKFNTVLFPGDILCIETPGGGGYGKKL